MNRTSVVPAQGNLAGLLDRTSASSGPRTWSIWTTLAKIAPTLSPTNSYPAVVLKIVCRPDRLCDRRRSGEREPIAP